MLTNIYTFFKVWVLLLLGLYFNPAFSAPNPDEEDWVIVRAGSQSSFEASSDGEYEEKEGTNLEPPAQKETTLQRIKKDFEKFPQKAAEECSDCLAFCVKGVWQFVEHYFSFKRS